MKTRHRVLLAVGLFGLVIALGCQKAEPTAAEPTAPVAEPVAAPAVPAPTVAAVAIPAPLAQEVAAEITDDNAVVAADQLEKELDQDLAEE